MFTNALFYYKMKLTAHSGIELSIFVDCPQVELNVHGFEDWKSALCKSSTFSDKCQLATPLVRVLVVSGVPLQSEPFEFLKMLCSMLHHVSTCLRRAPQRPI